MKLYHLTLQQPKAITVAINGNFTGPNNHEVVACHGSSLELFRPDESGKMVGLFTTECFSVIRSLTKFRLTGDEFDYILVGSDSGRITLLRAKDASDSVTATSGSFERIHMETFGKTGCRRIVPGQFTASDPAGRALMISAVEKQKFVYVMNRDSAGRLTISSPLEAHKAQTICFDICGMDVGFDNPVFACIELDYTDGDAGLLAPGRNFKNLSKMTENSGEDQDDALKKYLTLYELDLGLNHVVRKWSEPTDRGANKLIAVPAGNIGPGGVLVCAENWIIYCNPFTAGEDLRVPLPRRVDLPESRNILIVASATYGQSNSENSVLFLLLQSEFGDLYKVSLTCEDDIVTDLVVQYFDTTPVASSISITRTGLLFAASEFGNHYLYQFVSLGDDDDAAVGISALEYHQQISSECANENKLDLDVVPLFTPRVLTNLRLLDEVDSLSPLTDICVKDLANEGTSQIYALCGKGPRSSLRTLRHGLEVSELAVSNLPGTPSNIWTIRYESTEGKEIPDVQYIVVSFTDATLVLAVGDSVEEVRDSQLLGTEPTLACCRLAGGLGMVQVYPGGIRHILPDNRVNVWKVPGAGQSVVRGVCNGRQIALALTGGVCLYFEIDDASGTLEETGRKDLGNEITAVDIGEITKGRTRCEFLAVAGWDQTVRILSLDPRNVFEQLAVQALPSHAFSVCLTRGGTDKKSSMFLNVGLHNGTLYRSEVSTSTGALKGARQRFIGANPVSLVRMSVGGNPNGMLTLSSRPWLCYNDAGVSSLSPLSYEPFKHAAAFSNVHCEEGIVGVVGDSLRIVAAEKLGEMFNQSTLNLSYTPRKMCAHPTTNQLIIVEADHNAFNEKEKLALRAELGEDTMEGIKEEEDEVSEAQVGAPVPGVSGKWASCIRVVDPVKGETLHILELAAISVTCCVFDNRDGEVFLLVGTAKDLQLHPRKLACGYLSVYRFLSEGGGIELVHKTSLEDVPYALTPFQGRVLVSVGRVLRIYDMGKKKLLKKCQNKSVPFFITSIHTMGNRIYVGDINDAFFFLRYDKTRNEMTEFASDVVPRMLSRALLLDYDTVAGADKFGNFFVSRLPDDADETIVSRYCGDEGRGAVWDPRVGGSNPTSELDNVCNFHVGEILTSLCKTPLVPGASDVIVAGGIHGSLRSFLPLSTQSEIDFFGVLEMHMRQESISLVGRDHSRYRGYYAPSKGVIDGDLCEAFTKLSHEKQSAIAEEMERTVSDIVKNLEDTRNRVI